MRVLLITPYFYPKIGGVERHTYNIARGLTSLGHTVHVVTTLSDPNYAATETVDGITVTRMPIDYVVSMTPIGRSWARTLRRIIREFRPDVIEAHAPVPGLADLAYFLRRGTPYVIKYHSGDMRKGKNRLIDLALQIYQRTVLRHILTHADAIMSVYPDYVRSLVGKKSPIDFIPPGVDTTIFRPKKLKKKYDVLYVGRIEHASAWKGIDVLLDAVAIAKKRHKNIRVAMVGNGDAIEHFTNLAAELGVADNVEFLGTVQGESLVDTYNRSRMLVLPSLTEAESFGNVLIEAMACRLPVIGSRVGGIPNVITDGIDGYLFTRGSAAELARHIETILSDPDLSRRLGESGYQRATEFFSTDVLDQKTEAVLNRVASRRITHITTSYPPTIGGMQEAVRSIVSAQRNIGLDARVIAPAPGDDAIDRDDGVRYVTRLRKLQISHTKIIPGLLGALLKQDNKNINHLHVAHAFLPEMALVAHALKHFRYYAHMHFDFTPSTSAGKYLIPVYRRIVLGPFLRRAHRVIVPTLDYKSMLTDKYDLDADKVRVIPNGTTFDIANKPRRGVSRRRKINLIFVGRMGYQKNISELVEMMGRLIEQARDTGQTYTLHLVGDGDRRTSIEQQIKSLGISDSVIVHGAKSQHEVRDLYDKCDLFVSTSLYESFGIVLVEAMSRGLPIVAYDIIGARNVAVDSKNALLAQPHDINALVSHVAHLSRDDSMYSQISTQNIASAKNYRWPKIAHALQELYEETS